MNESNNTNEELDIDDFDKSSPHHQIFKHKPDFVRKTLAYHMLWLIAALSVILVLGVSVGCLSLDDAKDLAGTIISPLIAVFGTVVGFFFGSSTK
jgi:hypothetical protein